eukprot:CAMPEP_0202087438 /NCGR_PEP_ID=MMETSP0964-20121228/36157_1 /ASSEMBLY_ACC=CAM_ASM_000500 /TAXON_ID=4773 /ORGANISM="Schizochytrium aggregatum, Strain ATCC28209" /LENGTH=63 /DNA_ID=CAMNT_0048655399 /DNA_START=20 /DNA_END=211 /DNA_ORIENTATION=+
MTESLTSIRSRMLQVSVLFLCSALVLGVADWNHQASVIARKFKVRIEHVSAQGSCAGFKSRTS